MATNEIDPLQTRAEDEMKIKAYKKRMEEEKREQRSKTDFTYWLFSELGTGKKSLIAFLPFLPALASAVYSYFKDQFTSSGFKVTQQEVFEWSIIIQVVIIFCILVYQVMIFNEVEKDGLKEKIKVLIGKWKNKTKVNAGSNEVLSILYRFTHTNISKEDFVENEEEKKLLEPTGDVARVDKYRENFENDFTAAKNNILYFKISWIVLWVNWFCFYIALLMQSKSAVLFDFFMITETFCFAACYYRISSHVFESKTGDMNQYWWAVVIAALLFALGIADQATQDMFMMQMVISVIKTLFSCMFLGLLIGALTIHVCNSPNWLKLLLFIYVALQPTLFGILEMPSLTKSYFKRTVEDMETSRGPVDKIKHRHIDSLIENNGLVFVALNDSGRLTTFNDSIKFILTPKEGVEKNEKMLAGKLLFDTKLGGGKTKGKPGSIIKDSMKIRQTLSFGAKRDTLDLKKITFEADIKTPETIGNPTQVINDSVKISEALEVLLLNLCLALKYLLMFYFIWLLRYDHLLVFYLRTQGDQEYVKVARRKFEKEIESLNTDTKNEQQ